MATRPFSMLPAVLAFSLLHLSLASAIEVQPTPGLVIDNYIELRDLSAFTWDEHGKLWVLRETDERLIVDIVPKPGEHRWIGSFERQGNERPSLLVHANRVFISDGDAIRRFEVKGGNFLSEQSPWMAPAKLFPKQAQIRSLSWSPLGHISFLYRSTREAGVGRLEARRERWDVMAKGVDGDVAYDLNGFPIASDASTHHLFHLRLGLDYQHGLHNYARSDLALALDKAGLQPTAIVIHAGANWPEENRGTWLVCDRATRTLKQLREENGGLTHWRELARWEEQTSAIDLQIGPDGAIWLQLSDDKGLSSIHRMRPDEMEASANPSLDISALSTGEVVDVLKDSNSWRRETALRVLDDREELRQARGLHPGTPLHQLYNDTNATTIARVHALLALHRVELLDEVTLEGASADPDAALQSWAALLFGERNYPTGTAFKMVMKLAKGTNINVRMAAAIAARQFVSGSLAVDTAPRAMPIREVYTGGILSTLWFSSEISRSPSFDLLFWNALKPISGFDSAHTIGFFTEDFKESVPLAHWIVGLIAEQIAAQDDPLRQEDGMLMMANLKPTNPRLILAALEGLKRGTPQRRAKATDKSLNVLKDFSQSQNSEIAALGREISSLWQHSGTAIRPRTFQD